MQPDRTSSGPGEVRVRQAGAGDAEALLALKRWLDAETKFMLVEPDERTETVKDVEDALRRLAGISNSVLIVAESDGGGLAGYVEATGGVYRRERATAYVVLGVLAAASGRGVGGRLLDELAQWAAGHGVHRLELTVMASNDRALRLYERKGYLREGLRRQCLVVDDRLVDEFYMSKLL